MRTIKQAISENLFNIPGWRTSRHIVVFESDDWGSIRMPSRDVYEACLSHGYRVDKEVFTKYDSLASEEDLNFLFELLISFKDIRSNPPVITANCLAANPDFKKIRESGFNEYFYEPVTDTFQKYPRHKRCFEIWQEGSRMNVFKPQSHGREHLNVSRFMNDLKAGDKDAHFAFNYEMPGIFNKNAVEIGNNYVVSLEHSDENDKVEKEKITEEGLKLFKDLFWHESESFIPSNYTWHPDLELSLKNMGVKYIKGSKFQYIPKGNFKGFRLKFHYLGQRSAFNQIYLMRNVFFEPTISISKDCVSSALRQIDTAFEWHKPAIISTHRINFVGFIDPKNRDSNLQLFNELLKGILKRWPDVEFMSSVELGNSIAAGKHNQI